MVTHSLLAHPRPVFERQCSRSDLVLEEVDVFAELGDGVERRVQLEAEATHLRRRTTVHASWAEKED